MVNAPSAVGVIYQHIAPFLIDFGMICFSPVRATSSTDLILVLSASPSSLSSSDRYRTPDAASGRSDRKVSIDRCAGPVVPRSSIHRRRNCCVGFGREIIFGECVFPAGITIALEPLVGTHHEQRDQRFLVDCRFRFQEPANRAIVCKGGFMSTRHSPKINFIRTPGGCDDRNAPRPTTTLVLWPVWAIARIIELGPGSHHRRTSRIDEHRMLSLRDDPRSWPAPRGIIIRDGDPVAPIAVSASP